MKVYFITERDIEALLASIDRDPRYGYTGGSSQAMSVEDVRAHEAAHGFFNFHIRRWLDRVREDKS